MREIKFRAWDSTTKHMDYDPGNDSLRLNDIFTRSGDYDAFLQYTGLTDKNGTEIYEGDILGWHSRFVGTDIPTPQKRGEVKYNRQGCVFHVNYQSVTGERYHKELNADFSDGDTYQMNSVEVIGNIYETPEILESKLP